MDYAIRRGTNWIGEVASGWDGAESERMSAPVARDCQSQREKSFREFFVGGRRVKERTQARVDLARIGFLAGRAVNLERSAFLIAISAGEIGVDLDADHMACDLVAWERVVQRRGRVNRRGDGDVNVVVLVDTGRAPSDSTTKALERTDASCAAKEHLEELTNTLNARPVAWNTPLTQPERKAL